MNIFDVVIYNPLFNALIGLYHVLPGRDMGVAIIVLTVIIKFILYAPSLSMIRSQRSQQTLQPKLQEIRKQYANDRQEMGRKIMALYKEHRVNPFYACLPLLIQLPILWGLYQVFFNGLNLTDVGLLNPDRRPHLYGGLKSIYETTSIGTSFLGLFDLAARQNWVLAIIAGGLQFLQSKRVMLRQPPHIPGAKDEQVAATVSRQMTYLFPIVTVFLALSFPAGLALYWAISTLFTVIQQELFFRQHPLTV